MYVDCSDSRSVRRGAASVYARFMQPDPIGYGDGLNWYNYAGGDPVNGTDPSGTLCIIGGQSYDYDKAGCDSMGGKYKQDPDIVVTGRRGGGSFDLYAPRFNWDAYDPLDGGFARSLWSNIRNVLCRAPQPTVGGGVDAYAVAGGSIASAAAINPRNGQISIGFDLGVGLGLGGGGHASFGKSFGAGSPSAEAAPIAGAGVNVNATGVAGLVGATGSYQLIGSNPGDWSAAYAPGAEVSGNVNVSAHVQFNLPVLYNLRCHKQ